MRSFPLKSIIAAEYEISYPETPEGRREFIIKQQDNQLFRQIRLVTGHFRHYNPYVIFIDCKGVSDSADALSHLLYEGLTVNGVRFVLSERSASMTRVGVLSMIDESIADEIDKRVRMGIEFDKTVLSKYYAYRGLMFSSCHCLEGWVPKIIVVPDCETVIKGQDIKYIYDKETEIKKDDGTTFTWKQKDIAEDVRDIKVNLFDGCGIHHPLITMQVMSYLGVEENMTSILWRMPYIKGVTHEMDYEAFFEERGVEFIRDVWGSWHSIHDRMLILTESMYKGMKYFRKYSDRRDWDLYWDRFNKYQHCIGVAKWNFTKETEPLYTRANYQILQDLDLTYDKFSMIADYTVDWVEKIINGDPLYTCCFLGLTADNCTPINNYCRAVVKNPVMLKERSVRAYIVSLIKKSLDEMKCGKLWVRGSFKFETPDLVMLMEHIGGLPLNGCLDNGEFWSQDYYGDLSGEKLIERNPHICRSEHCILNAVSNELTDRWCKHLENVCMINSKGLTAQRLNGSDFDGDLVLVIDSSLMIDGVDRTVPIVMDIDDKITAKAEEDTKENRLALMKRTMKSMIGEYSNYSSAYHNKCPQSEEQREKYRKYVDIISVLTGKSIDYAKTGVLYIMPSYIAKYGRPLPYFMKYRSPYYEKQKLSRSMSNMNRLAFDLEKWEKNVKWRYDFKDFDYTVMLSGKPIDQDKLEKIEDIFLEFCREMQALSKDQAVVRLYEDDDIRAAITKYDAVNFQIDWNYYYENYRSRCEAACPDKSMLADICVKLVYEKYPKRQAKFMWLMAGDGVVENLRAADKVELPMRDDEGDMEYLGRRYKTALVDTDLILNRE